MSLRLSFTLDPELAERLDIFSRKQELDRNEAVLRLIESGLLQAEQSGIIPPARERDFKETARMQKNVDMLIRNIDELKKEVRVMHHTLNMYKEAADKSSVRIGRSLFKR
ncbi:MAG TPA: type II secretion system protein E [Methanocorpusculum sp.]|nr:type II secretion system protein E [Methanocorpusculum sp.]